MKNIFKSFLLITAVMLTSCQGLVEGINDNPNNISLDLIEAKSFLKGAQLASNNAQVGHLNRIAGSWSGQLEGYASVYGNAYEYNISTAETNSTWSRLYVGVIPNVRYIRAQLPDDSFFQGVTKVMEALTIGTAASLFGDVPYSEINNDAIDDPKFDGQVSVINAAIALLNEAIGDLSGATSRTLPEDIYYNGSAPKWLAAAYTIKARLHMYVRDYPSAYTAALSGISSNGDNMQHVPVGGEATSTDKNTFWQIIFGSRAGDLGFNGTYLQDLIDSGSTIYRGNAKTDETARAGYYTIKDESANDNLGIINRDEPQNIVSFEENHLILSEAGARASFATGLIHLNEYRAWLNTGGRLNDNFSGMTYQYEAYTDTDFMATGMENADGIDQTRALLREIIEERYVSGFGQFMPFDDARRLRTAESDISVPFTPNVGSQHAERFPYADDELNANSNGPAEDPGIFVKTPVNQ